MTNQTVPQAVGRSLGRGAVLAAAVTALSLSGGPAAHADDGGLLDGGTQIVGEAGEQVVEPVVQTVEPVVPPPVQQPVEAAVEQVVAPAVAEAEQTVEATVRVVEQAAEPVVAAVEPVTPAPAEPTLAAVPGGAQAPAAPRAPVLGGPSTGGIADQSVPAGAPHVTAQRTSSGGQDRSDAAAGTDLVDLAPRAMARPTILVQDPEPNDPSEDERIRALTNALMHMWAGEEAPGAVDAGLAGREATDLLARAAPSGPITLLLGLLLGSLSLVLARRRLDGSSDGCRSRRSSSVMVVAGRTGRP